MSLGLSRSEWADHVLGDIVVNVNDYFGAENDGVLPYVAGPHIKIGKTRVASYGLTSDDDFPPTFKRKFRHGDVLLHSRGIEKIAVVDRIGVTGEKLFVLRTKDQNVLLQEFLPWLLLSTQARSHMQDNFTGSVNKFLNWKPLAAMPIALPPIDEQKRLADLLWAIEDYQDAEEQESGLLSEAISRYCIDIYNRCLKNFPSTTFDQLGELLMGRQKAPKYMTGVGSKPYLRVANIGVLQLNLGEVEEMDFNEREIARYRLLPGDILLTEGDIVSPMNVGRPAIYNGEILDCSFQNTLIRFRPHVDADSSFFLALFEGMRLTGVFAGAASTTTVTHLGLGRLSAVPLPAVPFADQKLMGDGLRELLNVREAFNTAFIARSTLRNTIVVDIFGGAQ